MTNFAAMMRRLAVISVSLVLTGIIIALGAGVSFVRCHHARTVEIAQLADMTETGGTACGGTACGGCCHDKGESRGEGTRIVPAGCMETVTMTLGPTFTAQQHTLTMQTVYALLPSFADMAGRATQPTGIIPRARHTANAPHSPPRAYLRRLVLLLI